MGYVAMHRIEASGGRLYGLVPATLAFLGPVLIVLDVLAVAFVGVTFRTVPPEMQLVILLALLYWNYRFVERRVRRQGRDRRVRTAGHP